MGWVVMAGAVTTVMVAALESAAPRELVARAQKLALLVRTGVVNEADVAPDTGLLVGTYFGYFIVGLAMLGIGMTASFLTTDRLSRSNWSRRLAIDQP